MARGDPGAEQFANIIVSCRNRHIAAGISPLMDMREELTTNEDIKVRNGIDTPSQVHFMQHLVRCDEVRRFITHNPDAKDLGDKIAKAIDANATIEQAVNPMGGDDIQMGSTGEYTLPWDFSGADNNVPIMSQLDLSNHGVILLGGIDAAIVAYSRLNSRHRQRFITAEDSFRIYGHYQQILAYLQTFGGDANRVDFSNVRASDEPRGPENAPNRITEVPNPAFQPGASS